MRLFKEMKLFYKTWNAAHTCIFCTYFKNKLKPVNSSLVPAVPCASVSPGSNKLKFLNRQNPFTSTMLCASQVQGCETNPCDLGKPALQLHFLFIQLLLKQKLQFWAKQSAWSHRAIRTALGMHSLHSISTYFKTKSHPELHWQSFSTYNFFHKTLFLLTIRYRRCNLGEMTKNTAPNEEGPTYVTPGWMCLNKTRPRTAITPQFK